MALNNDLQTIKEYIENESYQKAIELLLECTKNYEDDYRVYYNFGYCYYKVEKFQLALDYLNLSLKENNSNPKVIYLLSLINRKIGFINKAYDYVLELKELFDHSEKYKNLFESLLHDKKHLLTYYKNCIESLSNNNELNPSSCFKWLFILNIKIEDYEKAYFNLEKYLSLNANKTNLDIDIKNIIIKDNISIENIKVFFEKNKSKYSDNKYYLLYDDFINNESDNKLKNTHKKEDEFKILIITLIIVIGFSLLLFASILLLNFY